MQNTIKYRATTKFVKNDNFHNPFLGFITEHLLCVCNFDSIYKTRKSRVEDIVWHSYQKLIVDVN